MCLPSTNKHPSSVKNKLPMAKARKQATGKPHMVNPTSTNNVVMGCSLAYCFPSSSFWWN